MTAPLMPKATAVWLVDNTALTFRQIATFCELHELEIQAIADGDVAFNIIGLNPIMNGQLTAEEIKRCEADPAADLVACVMEKNVKEINARNKKVLTPSQRMDKPSAILWLINNCPDLTDAQICKLVGTTKPTIAGIRNGTREDMIYLRAKNPVAVGLCSEYALDDALKVAREKNEKAAAKLKKEEEKKKKAAAKKKTAKKKAAEKVKAKKAKEAAKKTATKKKAVKKRTVTKTKAAAKKTVTKTKAATKAKKVAAKKAPAKKKAATKTKAATKKTVTKTKAATKAKATVKKAPAKKKASKKK
ncbi:MAG: DUF1013 domain-containing protein [Alphaproteobacteria bacterium]|nr:DUF1013 domain-containing protein [Alphaproteobacteria bacterium]